MHSQTHGLRQKSPLPAVNQPWNSTITLVLTTGFTVVDPWSAPPELSTSRGVPSKNSIFLQNWTPRLNHLVLWNWLWSDFNTVRTRRVKTLQWIHATDLKLTYTNIGLERSDLTVKLKNKIDRSSEWEEVQWRQHTHLVMYLVSSMSAFTVHRVIITDTQHGGAKKVKWWCRLQNRERESFQVERKKNENICKLYLLYVLSATRAPHQSIPAEAAVSHPVQTEDQTCRTIKVSITDNQ